MDLKKWSMGIFLRKNRYGRNPKLSLGSPPMPTPVTVCCLVSVSIMDD